MIASGLFGYLNAFFFKIIKEIFQIEILVYLSLTPKASAEDIKSSAISTGFGYPLKKKIRVFRFYHLNKFRLF